MIRIGIIGAGGQVGAEVTLLLAGCSDLSVIPICRNRASSAFLRYMGISCRHGDVSDPAQATGLIGDCDLVADFALALGPPRKSRQQNLSRLEAVVKYSQPGSRLIFFSTQSVYGDPHPLRWFRWLSSYGADKRAQEKYFLGYIRKYKRLGYVLRLGHVFGFYQNIREDIRKTALTGRVNLPEGGRLKSNVVFTETIAEGILNIARGHEPLGTYDLMCEPQWTWQEVYKYEANRLNVPLEISSLPPVSQGSLLRLFLNAVKQRVLMAVWNQTAKEFIRRLCAYFPIWLGERVEAMYRVRWARTEINKLDARTWPNENVCWKENGRHFLPGLTLTKKLLETGKYKLPDHAQNSFPPDLPYYMVAKK